MVDIDIQVDDSQLNANIRILGTVLKGERGALKPILEPPTNEYARWNLEQFDRKSRGGSSEGGKKWKPLAERTKKSKKGDRMLVRSGTLRKTLRPTRHRKSWYRILSKRGRVGSKLVYARFHHFGLKSGKVNIPQRPILEEPTPAVERRVAAKMQQALDVELVRRGIDIR